MYLVFRFPFSPFRFCSSLRPLRSLREVCLRAVMIFLHADYAESAEFFIFLGVLRWRWRGRKLRYDERAQRGRCKRGSLITFYIAFVTQFRTQRAVSLLLL